MSRGPDWGTSPIERKAFAGHPSLGMYRNKGRRTVKHTWPWFKKKNAKKNTGRDQSARKPLTRPPDKKMRKFGQEVLREGVVAVAGAERWNLHERGGRGTRTSMAAATSCMPWVCWASRNVSMAFQSWIAGHRCRPAAKEALTIRSFVWIPHSRRHTGGQ